MNFLQIVQELRRECGVAGTGPSTVSSQTGQLNDLVQWAANSYTELQNRHGGRWRFLRRGFTLSTVTDDDTYAYSDATDTDASAAISRFGAWLLNDVENPPKIYKTSDGVGTERWLIWVDWDWFRQIYKIGTQNSGSPAHITVDPQDNIVIGPKPNGVYTITGEFYRSAQVLSDDSDEPEMPSQFHQLIVYKAMEKYAGYESAHEVMVRAHGEGRPMLRQLENNQLPLIKRSKPMA